MQLSTGWSRDQLVDKSKKTTERNKRNELKRLTESLKVPFPFLFYFRGIFRVRRAVLIAVCCRSWPDFTALCGWPGFIRLKERRVDLRDGFPDGESSSS